LCAFDFYADAQIEKDLGLGKGSGLEFEASDVNYVSDEIIFETIETIESIDSSAETVPLKDSINDNSSNFAIYNRIGEYFSNRNEQNRFNGVVLYAEKGKVIYKKSFGYTDFRNKKELTDSSSFQIASVSKPITATAIMVLQQQKLINLEDSVGSFFPGFPFHNVQVKHLLSHQSGLPEYLYFSEKLWKDKKKTMRNVDVVTMLLENEIKRYGLPEKKYNYVNTNFALLASIVEVVSGKSFSDFVNDNIFKPANMTNSFVYEKGITELPINATYGHDNRQWRESNSHFNGVVGDKGIYTTVEDLLKFDSALLNETIITNQTQQLAFTPQHENLNKLDNYGLGWRISEKEDGSKTVYHGGWWNGYRSHFIRMLDEEKTIIVLTNCTKGGFLKNNVLKELFTNPSLN